MLECCLCGRHHLVVVSRTENGHTGNGTHKSNILEALVGSTILTCGDTCVASCDFYIELGITHGVTNLLVCSACCKHCERCCNGNFSTSSKTGSNTHHITLCDTAVKKSLGEFLLEDRSLGSTCKVCIKNNNFIIFFCQLTKSHTEALSGSLCYNICHQHSASNPAI